MDWVQTFEWFGEKNVSGLSSRTHPHVYNIGYTMGKSVPTYDITIYNMIFRDQIYCTSEEYMY